MSGCAVKAGFSGFLDDLLSASSRSVIDDRGESIVFLRPIVSRAARNPSRTSRERIQGAFMKFTTVAKGLTLGSGLILGSSLILASSAFAASKGTLELNRPLTVNGTELMAGRYTVRWQGTGPDVELRIMKGRDVLARVPAHVVGLETRSPNSAAITRDNGSGNASLAGVLFQGKKFSLELGQGSLPAQDVASTK
jgi:hypothetical protein